MSQPQMDDRSMTFELLESYKTHCCLWDVHNVHYSNRDRRKEAYNILLQIYKKVYPNATVAVLKKKIENMRSAYRREEKKVIASEITSGGNDQVYVPKLWYYENMNFISENTAIGTETQEEEGHSTDSLLQHKEDNLDVEKLIEQVRQFPFLYDQSFGNHHSLEYTEKVWNSIARNLEVKGGAEECKKKWISIRDHLRRVLQKRRGKSGQGAAKIYRYKYEDALAFLIPHLGELTDGPKQENKEDYLQESDDYQEDWTQETSETQLVEEEITNEDIPHAGRVWTAASSSSQFSENQNRLVITKAAKRKTPDSQDSLSSQMLAYILSEKDGGNKFPQHPVDAFLAGIAPSLKALNPHLLIEAKGKIFAVVQEMEMRQIQLDYQD